MAEIITFGCKLNFYESGIIKANSLKVGLAENVFIFNTCSVTQSAENEAVRKIRKLKRQNPNANIIVTGCAAQINSHKFASLPEVTAVIGNKEKIQEKSYELIKNAFQENKSIASLPIISHVKERYEDALFTKEREIFPSSDERKILVNDIMSVRETASHFSYSPVIETETRSRAFVQIQTGCNHRCTFCIIPFARGNSQSVPFGELNKEVAHLVEKGYKEIVLTGVDITDYGKDLPGNKLTLVKMIRRLLDLNPALPRLRCSSIDVGEIQNDIYELIQEPRFMPYFHISLQSGDNLILKRMKRRHTREHVIDFTQKVKEIRPESAFGADIIAGFPTESDENFENSKSLIQEAQLSFCHIFPFSPHKGTPAAKMPQVQSQIIRDRTAILINEGKKQLYKTMKGMLGKSHAVLVEANDNVRCENFISGHLSSTNISNKTDPILKGDIRMAYAQEIQNERIIFNLN